MLQALQINASNASNANNGNGRGKNAILNEEEKETRNKWLKMATDVCELFDRVHGPNAPLVAIAQPLREVVDATATGDAAAVAMVASRGNIDQQCQIQVATWLSCLLAASDSLS